MMHSVRENRSAFLTPRDREILNKLVAVTEGPFTAITVQMEFGLEHEAAANALNRLYIFDRLVRVGRGTYDIREQP